MYDFDALKADFGAVAFLNSNDVGETSYLALGAKRSLQLSETKGAFEQLRAFYRQATLPVFGFLSYDLKNDVEKLESRHPNVLAFPELCFFEPEYLFRLEGNYVTAVSGEVEMLKKYETSMRNNKEGKEEILGHTDFSQRISQDEYLKIFERIQYHIHRGDIYEVNFCQEFFKEQTELIPGEVYHRLNALSIAPFSSYFAFKDYVIISASPERFMKRTGECVISQPIKGTIKRGNSSEEDEALKSALKNNPKEVNENTMIVDLVRNDLSHFAKRGTVTVEELCGIYTFKTVHQMISTVAAQVDMKIDSTALIKQAFPMGSMTGVPKIRAMQLMDELESFRRGPYSGALGYIQPNGDFDMSVLIRSLFYNRANKYLSFGVGSAITAGATAQLEYDECLLKAEALIKSLQHKEF